MAVAGLCEHNAWLHLTGKVGETIRYGQRYSRIIQEMTNPSAQFPSLTFFMGRKRKEAALRVIFPHNNTPKKQQVTDTVKLRIDNATLNAEHPLLFADCDLNQIKLQSDDCYHLCHPDQRLPFTSAASAAHPPFDILLTRLFFLFTDVICIFAEDLGGLENVQKSLMRWATVGSASTLPANVRPRVLIVTHNDEPGVANALFEEEDFCYNVPQGSGIGMGQTFASIRTLKLPGRYLSPLAQYQRLREEILRETDISREDRIATFSLFSAVHQNAFFEKALLHTLRTIREPFNFVQAAHHRDLAAADIRHLTNFLELCIQKRLSYDAVTSVLATSILMDAFPPGKPRTFVISLA